MNWCGGCGGDPNPSCRGAFARIGINKVHWECWSKCNLACQFCYRTVDVPAKGTAAERLVDAVATSGALSIAFVGGDPSLRRDLPTLAARARASGLRVEIQTNAQHLSPDFLEALRHADLVGLSLDGPDPASHDSFRNKPGNFDKVIALLDILNRADVPVLVRSVVAKPNASALPQLGQILSQYSNIMRWSLLEFTAVGEGHLNQLIYSIESEQYDEVAIACESRFSGSVDRYRNDNKKGTYALVTASGRLYGTSDSLDAEGRYLTVGSMLTDHLADLATRLPFSEVRHQSRYRWETVGLPSTEPQ